jgi:hypothetical protein
MQAVGRKPYPTAYHERRRLFLSTVCLFSFYEYVLILMSPEGRKAFGFDFRIAPGEAFPS